MLSFYTSLLCVTSTCGSGSSTSCKKFSETEMSAIWLIWVITSIETYLPWNCMLVVNAVKSYNLRTHYCFDIFGFLVSHSMTSTPSSCKYLVFQLENDFDLRHYYFGFGTKWPERELLWVCRFSFCINLINNCSSLVTHLLVNNFPVIMIQVKWLWNQQ